MPEHLDVHLVCDNYGTHKSPAIKKWLAAHPRFHMHYTPTYSGWLNQVERWFAYLTDDLLRRGDHRSVQALERTSAPGSAWNENPKPFIWTKTADQILESTRTTNTRIKAQDTSAPRQKSSHRTKPLTRDTSAAALRAGRCRSGS